MWKQKNAVIKKKKQQRTFGEGEKCPNFPETTVSEIFFHGQESIMNNKYF